MGTHNQLTILSSCYGKIEKLFLAIPKNKLGAQVKEEAVLERYERIFKAFGDRVQFVVLGDFEKGSAFDAMEQGLTTAFARSNLIQAHHVWLLDAFKVKEAQEKNGGKVGEDDCHNEWVQDPFTILSNTEGSSVLLEPMQTIHEGNAVLAEQISAETEHLIKSSRVLFEGGNILAGDDYVIIGENTRKANLRYHLGEEYLLKSETEEGVREIRRAKLELDQKLRVTFGVKYIIWVGLENPLFLNHLKVKKENEEWQPLFHIDLFISLAGRSHDKEYQGDELIFVGQLRQDSKKNYQDVTGEVTPEIKSDLDQLRDALDETAGYLKALETNQDGPRFDVVRLPLGVVLGKEPVVYSWNNCLVEYYQGIRRVYLPYFHHYPSHNRGKSDCKCAQCTVTKAFKGRGFRVNWVDGAFDLFVNHRGSLHCLTKVLQRKY